MRQRKDGKVTITKRGARWWLVLGAFVRMEYAERWKARKK
jgi:hypothetical protein